MLHLHPIYGALLASALVGWWYKLAAIRRWQRSPHRHHAAEVRRWTEWVKLGGGLFLAGLSVGVLAILNPRTPGWVAIVCSGVMVSGEGTALFALDHIARIIEAAPSSSEPAHKAGS